MDIEKTYELMNKLEMFKRFNECISKSSLSKLSDGLYLSIFCKIFENLKEPYEFKTELINLLNPILEQKIKELEEEIKNK